MGDLSRLDDFDWIFLGISFSMCYGVSVGNGSITGLFFFERERGAGEGWKRIQVPPHSVAQCICIFNREQARR